LIPREWAKRHPEVESRIKGGRDLTLLLCPNCHAWVHDEQRKWLRKDATEEEMHQFVSDILRRCHY